MKNSKFHTSSFLLGTLAGAMVILLLAIAVPARTEINANQNSREQEYTVQDVHNAKCAKFLGEHPGPSFNIVPTNNPID